MSNEHEALKPCPFCGGEPFVERADYSSCYVICNDCSARGPVSCDESDADADATESGECEPGEMAARRLWNANAAPTDALITDLRREVGALRATGLTWAAALMEKAANALAPSPSQTDDLQREQAITAAAKRILALAPSPRVDEGRAREVLVIPVLNPVYAEEHPLLAPIIEKRARAAGNFAPEFSGQRGQDFDRGLLCAFEAVNGKLQQMTALATQSPADPRELTAALDQNDAMRQELAHVGNLVSDLAAALKVDQANDDGSWPRLAGRIQKLIDTVKASPAEPRVGKIEAAQRVVNAVAGSNADMHTSARAAYLACCAAAGATLSKIKGEG